MRQVRKELIASFGWYGQRCIIKRVQKNLKIIPPFRGEETGSEKVHDFSKEQSPGLLNHGPLPWTASTSVYSFACWNTIISLCDNNTNVSGGNVKYLHLEEWAVFQVVVVVVWCANERKMVRTETSPKKIWWGLHVGRKQKGV